MHHISEIMKEGEFKDLEKSRQRCGNCHLINPSNVGFITNFHSSGRVLMAEFLDCKLTETSGFCLIREFFDKELCSGNKCDGEVRAPVCLWCGNW